MHILEQLVSPFLAVAAVAYVLLAIRLSRAAELPENTLPSIILALIGALIGGSSLSFDAGSITSFNVGRTLSFSASSWVSLAFFCIYRDLTKGIPSLPWLLLLAAVPVLTTSVSMSNSLHEMLWSVAATPDGLQSSRVTDHAYYRFVHAPYIYGLFAFSAIMLLTQLQTIAPAHRGTLVAIVLSAALPFVASAVNSIFGFGSTTMPISSLILGLMFPVFAYFVLSLKVQEFSPLAYKTLFNHVRDPIMVVDAEQRIICANRSAQQLLGSDESDLLGQELMQDFPQVRKILEQARELDLTQTLKLENKGVYEVSVAPLAGPKGRDIGMVIVCRDVTARRQALSQLANSEHLVRTLIETSSNGILRFSRDEEDPGRRFRCVFANSAAERFAGPGGGSLVGMPIEKLDFIEPDRLLEHFDVEDQAASQVSFEVAGDEESWIRVVGEPVGSDFSVTLLDITQRKRSEDKMLADALRDPLTGVLNRRGFEQEGNGSIRRSEIGAVLYLDLNHFKAINDRFGHQAGDALLKAFGHRLEFCLRPEDVLGRLGGDEFAIVLPDVGIDDVRHIAERLVRSASEAYIIQGQEIQCTASVGVALMPKHGAELWHLLSVADAAMYAVKSAGPDAAANDVSAYVDAAMAS